MSWAGCLNIVVHQDGFVGGVGLKVKETAQLLLDAVYIVGKGLLVKQVPFLALHRRVSDHSRGTSHKGYRLMAASLEVLEYHNAYKMSYVK